MLLVIIEREICRTQEILIFIDFRIAGSFSRALVHAEMLRKITLASPVFVTKPTVHYRLGRECHYGNGDSFCDRRRSKVSASSLKGIHREFLSNICFYGSSLIVSNLSWWSDSESALSLSFSRSKSREEVGLDHSPPSPGCRCRRCSLLPLEECEPKEVSALFKFLRKRKVHWCGHHQSVLSLKGRDLSVL